MPLARFDPGAIDATTLARLQECDESLQKKAWRAGNMRDLMLLM